VSETEAEFVGRAMQRWIDLVAARDLAGLEAFLDECYTPDAQVDLGLGEGPMSVRVLLEWARAAFEEWEDEGSAPRYELVGVTARGDEVIATTRSVSPVEGQLMEASFAYVFRLSDGKVAAMTLAAPV
jgi:ketosteroid isomerase-like protein